MNSKWKRKDVRDFFIRNRNESQEDSTILKEEEKEKVADESKNKETKEEVIEKAANAVANGVTKENVTEIVELLNKISKDNAETLKYVKRQSIFSSIAVGICGVILIALIIVGCNVAPTFSRLVAETESLIAQTDTLVSQVNSVVAEADSVIKTAETSINGINGMMEEVQTVVTNVNTITEELAQTDIKGMLEDVNSFVETSEDSVTVAVDKINEIDFTSLNDAITDLGKVIAPLAKLFGGKK